MKNITRQDIEASFELVRLAFSKMKPEGLNPFSRAEFLETLEEIKQETIENFKNGKLDSVISELNWNSRILKDSEIIRINQE